MEEGNAKKIETNDNNNDNININVNDNDNDNDNDRVKLGTIISEFNFYEKYSRST